MKTLVSQFLKDHSGATSIEYAVIVAFFSLGIITVLPSISFQLTNPFHKVTIKLMEANKSPGVVPRI